MSEKQIQALQEKLCFFTIHCNPSLAYIAVRDEFWRGRGSKLSRILGKNTIFNEHPVNWVIVRSDLTSMNNSVRPPAVRYSSYLRSICL